MVFCFIFKQTRHQQQQITGLQNEADTIRKDNVKLYEKIKFLQSYPNQKVAIFFVSNRQTDNKGIKRDALKSRY